MDYFELLTCPLCAVY